MRLDESRTIQDRTFKFANLNHFSDATTTTTSQNLMTMERPTKRPRLGQVPRDNAEDDDELDLQPDEVNDRLDPGYQLRKGREKAANKLKSRWELTMEKWGNILPEDSDEIDLMTMDVVVDNGHLRSVRQGQELGVTDGEEDDEELLDEEAGVDSEEEEQRILHGTSVEDNGLPNTMAVVSRIPSPQVAQNWPSLTSLMGASPRLSSMLLPNQIPVAPPARSRASLNLESVMGSIWQAPDLPGDIPDHGLLGDDASPFGAELGILQRSSVDPKWQAPEIPESAFLANNFSPPVATFGPVRGSSPKTVVRKFLSAPENVDDDKDDVLLGVSGNTLLTEHFTSPIGVSPGLNGLIEEFVSDAEKMVARDKEISPSIKVTKMRRMGDLRGISTESAAKSIPGNQQPATAQKPNRGRPFGTVKGQKSVDKILAPLERVASSSPVPTTVTRRPGRSRRQPSSVTKDQEVDASTRNSTQDEPAEEFRDITDADVRIPAGQRISIQIQARKVGNRNIIPDDAPEPEEPPEPTSLGTGLSEPNLQAALSTDVMMDGQEAVFDSQGPTLKDSPTPTTGDSVTHEPPVVKETFSRNIVDPAYMFSDEDDLPPKRKSKQKFKTQPQVPCANRAQKEATKEPRPEEAQPATEITPLQGTKQSLRSSSRSEVATGVQLPSVTAPDGDTNESERPKEPPFKKIRPAIDASSDQKARRSSRLSRTTELAVEVPAGAETPLDLPEVDSCEKDVEKETPAEDTHMAQDTSLQQEPRRSLRSSRISEVAPEVPVEAQGLLSPPVVQLEERESTAKALDVVSISATHLRDSRRNIASPELGTLPSARARSQKQQQDQPVESPELGTSLPLIAPEAKLDTRSLRPRQSQRATSLDLGTKPSPAVIPASIDPEINSQTDPAPADPSTPQRKKVKSEKPTPDPSPWKANGIISLISDDEDEEDELSFNHGDFTPSGHHRILVHRPSPLHPSSAGTPKRRGSVLLDSNRRAHAPMTGSTGKMRGRMSWFGSAPGRKRYSLPRSVVRVRGNRSASPAESLVRTPGGTMRRCGEDGFRCDRDFCFVCI